jgi:3-oxoacyl-[acyl-carrier protein] reductase
MSNLPLSGKIAVVTGASRGIGRAIAVRLARIGAYVILNYRSQEEEAQQALLETKAASSNGAKLIKADISKSAEANRLIDTVLAEHGQIDILINNAGIQRAVLIHKMSDADWHEVIDTNLSSIFYLCRAVLPSMIKLGKGHIINVGSASGFMGHKGAASYVSSKHALTGLTKVLALETADKGILVNTIAPGVTDTDMIGSLSETARERLLMGVPLKRIASAEEVAAMVAFLVTEATYSTGNTFHASGGLILG